MTKDSSVQSSIPIKNTTERWGAVSMAMHWIMALIMIGLLAGGFIMVNILGDEQFELKYELYQIHKSFGFVIFSLFFIRFLWRLQNKIAPPLPDNLKSWEKKAAKIVHYGLYFVMILMPITGYLMVSSSLLQIPTMIFGVIEVPHLIAPDEQISHYFMDIHEFISRLFFLFLFLHIGAAAKHHLILKDNVLRRMLPVSLKHKEASK